jgi:hypothetical protein
MLAQRGGEGGGEEHGEKSGAVDAHGDYSPVPKIAPGCGSESECQRLEVGVAEGSLAACLSRAWAGW